MEYPLILYALDFEMDGILDPLMSAFWKDQNGKMKEYLVNYLDDLKEQSSFIQTRFKDYTSFSYTGASDILDDNLMKRVEFKLHVKHYPAAYYGTRTENLGGRNCREAY